MKLATDHAREQYITFLRQQELPLDVDQKPWKPTRSNEQNALLFGVLYPPIAEAMGYEVEAIHEYMCGRHFGWVDVKVPKTPRNPEGIASEPLRSTTREGWHSGKRNVLDKHQFSEFLATVERVASQAGVFIPLEQAA